MRIFADHCVAKFFVEALRHEGFDLKRAHEAGLDKATDELIFDYALANARVLLTFDRDFTNILRFNIKASPGVVIFGIDGLSKETVRNRIVGFFRSASSSYLAKTLFIVDLGGRIYTWPKK